MSDWTEAEQAAIEQAADRLKHVMVDLDAIDAAYDIANAIRPAVDDAARSILVQAAAELNRQWRHAIDSYDAKAGPEWTQEHALYCKGKAFGAVKALQATLTGPGSIDGNCDEAWKAVDEYQEVE